MSGGGVAKPPPLELSSLGMSLDGDDTLSPRYVKRRADEEAGRSRSRRRVAFAGSGGGDSPTTGLLSPTSAAAVAADNGYDNDGLLDEEFIVELPPADAHAAEPLFMDLLLPELTAAGAPPSHVIAAQHALDGPRVYTMTANDIAFLIADNDRALRAQPGRVMPEVYASAGAAPLVAGAVVDPRGVDTAHAEP